MSVDEQLNDDEVVKKLKREGEYLIIANERFRKVRNF